MGGRRNSAGPGFNVINIFVVEIYETRYLQLLSYVPLQRPLRILRYLEGSQRVPFPGAVAGCHSAQPWGRAAAWGADG